MEPADSAPPPGTLWIVGAGPGAADLITVRGRELIGRAGAILYAGSLVSRDHLAFAPVGCEIADSSGLTLEAMTAWLIERCRRLSTVIRLQTGDPSLYGALVEMSEPLERAGIPIRVVPGVSSAMAAAAAAGESLTFPEVTQTVILTRAAGRTPMPTGESLKALAAHRTTLCLFLSATLLDQAMEDFLAAGWSPEAPLVVVHKATWPGEERVLRLRLGDLARGCREAGVREQAMVILSPALRTALPADRGRSRLYDPAFSHHFRTASPGSGPEAPSEQAPSPDTPATGRGQPPAATNPTSARRGENQ
ncbi:MAG: precorrin-4 C(11)-methyltransferase [Magnetococcales bacterium]|nr:precorrin-4 C(11)-methyltransferase [Magnetococcales bacterium]